MNIIIASDSFKGTLSSKEISNIFEKSFNKYFSNDKLFKVNIADGGEGSIDAFKDYIEGKDISLNVKGPHFNNVNSKYFLSNNNTAIIEVASCASLCLAEPNLNPLITTTYGVGEQIKDAYNRGAKKIILCLGGSSTNDAMAGALSAIGAKFFNSNNEEFVPTGGTLNQITDIDIKEIDKYKNIEFILMSDCKNPTFGTNGAAYVYAPQKGADEKMIVTLDDNLKYFVNIVKNKFKINFENVEGTGAAGAFGYGAMAFLNAKMESGINLLLDYIDFDSMLEKTDLVFTGEGKFDKQSLNGKVISGIIKHAKAKRKPIVIVAGSIDKEVEEIKKEEYLIKGIFSTNRLALDYSKIKQDQKNNYEYTIDSILSLLKNDLYN